MPVEKASIIAFLFDRDRERISDDAFREEAGGY
jgi:hypothetical protein